MPRIDGISRRNAFDCEAHMDGLQCSDLRKIIVEQYKIIEETGLEEGLACVDQEPFFDAASCYTLMEKRQKQEMKSVVTTVHYLRARCTCYDNEKQSVGRHPSMYCSLIKQERTASWVDAAVMCLYL